MSRLAGWLVTIDYDPETSKLTFVKESRGALVGGETNPDLEMGWLPTTRQQPPLELRLQ